MQRAVVRPGSQGGGVGLWIIGGPSAHPSSVARTRKRRHARSGSSRLNSSRRSSITGSGRESGAVAALELLARAAPARLVATELVVLGGDNRGCGRRARGSRRGGRAAPGAVDRRRDRIRARKRLVLVHEVPVPRTVLGQERLLLGVLVPRHL